MEKVDTQGDRPAGQYDLAGGGVVEHGAGKVTFRLFAPGKHSVALIGDFNGWDAYADSLAPSESGMWAIEKQLAPGRHEYRYVVDEKVSVVDPYARIVTQETENRAQNGILEVGAASYEWQHDAGWRRPPFRELAIYETHVLDFSPEGNFNGLAEGLDYLADLGITAVELMPVMEFAGEDGGESSWGYDPMYFFALHPAYGSPTEFKRLVDAAHARGIAVILDVVLAHTSRRHPFRQLHEWHESPYYGPGLGEVNQFGFPMLDFGKPATRTLADDILAYWLCEYHVDGIRFDYAIGIGAHFDLGLPGLVVAARKLDQDAYLIAEYLPEQQGILRGSAFDGAWHGRFKSALWALLYEREYRDFSGWRFREATSTFDLFDDGYTDVTLPVNYMESHDEERIAPHLAGELGFDAAAIQRKLMLAATVLFTLPGVPMLYHGQEWGEATEKQVNRPNPLRWEGVATPAGAALVAHYRAVAALRRAHPALCSLDLDFLLIDRAAQTVVYRRWDGAGDDLVVALNFSPVDQQVAVHLPGEEGRAHEWSDLNDETAPCLHGVATLKIGAYSSITLVRRNPA